MRRTALASRLSSFSASQLPPAFLLPLPSLCHATRYRQSARDPVELSRGSSRVLHSSHSDNDLTGHVQDRQSESSARASLRLALAESGRHELATLARALPYGRNAWPDDEWIYPSVADADDMSIRALSALLKILYASTSDLYKSVRRIEDIWSAKTLETPENQEQSRMLAHAARTPQPRLVNELSGRLPIFHRPRHLTDWTIHLKVLTLPVTPSGVIPRTRRIAQMLKQMLKDEIQVDAVFCQTLANGLAVQIDLLLRTKPKPTHIVFAKMCHDLMPVLVFADTPNAPRTDGQTRVGFKNLLAALDSETAEAQARMQSVQKERKIVPSQNVLTETARRLAQSCRMELDKHYADSALPLLKKLSKVIHGEKDRLGSEEEEANFKSMIAVYHSCLRRAFLLSASPIEKAQEHFRIKADLFRRSCERLMPHLSVHTVRASLYGLAKHSPSWQAYADHLKQCADWSRSLPEGHRTVFIQSEHPDLAPILKMALGAPVEDEELATRLRYCLNVLTVLGLSPRYNVYDGSIVSVLDQADLTSHLRRVTAQQTLRLVCLEPRGGQ
ncbi:uncharacterized protein L969DRAFT_78004 [Mixia osmundae IAM 14324]|uniref:Uncharacterized protein n=1 Tax=Mixia osmundae (strain CBS 9802 / IAM 14324 / JCM 22182 / KY 12970) TaxID=764103 RepID=G7DVI7_MIXOS|nr:uncharacterized protein L969DRAFT_78004 [Mixia osmundae IAM 14324]KEI37705.1 hypothetical protein L969DRAFT_78004 [Mixia osmundae IAM 14324]GAA94597.1 hypothetical protein E5Q_01249 [Mixia osmundae IAM 14324]